MKEQPTANHALENSASPALTSRGYPSEDHTAKPVVTESALTTMYPYPPRSGRTQSLLSDRRVNNLVWCLVLILFVSTMPFKLFSCSSTLFYIGIVTDIKIATAYSHFTDASYGSLPGSTLQHVPSSLLHPQSALNTSLPSWLPVPQLTINPPLRVFPPLLS